MENGCFNGAPWEQNQTKWRSFNCHVWPPDGNTSDLTWKNKWCIGSNEQHRFPGLFFLGAYAASFSRIQPKNCRKTLGTALALSLSCSACFIIRSMCLDRSIASMDGRQHPWQNLNDGIFNGSRYQKKERVLSENRLHLNRWSSCSNLFPNYMKLLCSHMFIYIYIFQLPSRKLREWPWQRGCQGPCSFRWRTLKVNDPYLPMYSYHFNSKIQDDAPPIMFLGF